MNEYNEGDLVEAIRGEQMIRGRLNGRRTGFYFVGDSARTTEGLTGQGWAVTVLERATPPLPTEPGLYLSSQEHGPWIFRLNEAGDWWLINTGSPFPIGDGHLERHAPFTRLEPVADTAKKVLQAIEREYGEDYLHNDDPSWNKVAIEFGVTK